MWKGLLYRIGWSYLSKELCKVGASCATCRGNTCGRPRGRAVPGMEEDQQGGPRSSWREAPCGKRENGN